MLQGHCTHVGASNPVVPSKDYLSGEMGFPAAQDLLLCCKDIKEMSGRPHR